MKIVIYASKDTTVETLQQIVDDAATAKWLQSTDELLRETRPPLPNPAMRGYVNLSGATIQQIHQSEERAMLTSPAS